MRTRIGDYEVEGFGAAGVVRYAATHVLLPRRAVIEMFDPAEPRSHAVRLMRRACVLEALHHPGIPRVFECGLLDGRPWVAFEHIDGVSLETDIRTRRLGTGEVLDMIEQVAAILADAHARGVLHRDMSPAAIFRCQGRGYPFVLDGWANACTHDTELASPLKGSHRYRAPELVDDQPADGRADVYALGAIAYRCVTGRAPFKGRDLAELVYQVVHAAPMRPSALGRVSPLVEAVLAIAMAKDPRRRFPSAQAFAQAFIAARRGRAPAIDPPHDAWS